MRAAKIDANHEQITKTIRNMGATVQSIASVGRGCPDVVIGYRGRNFLAEYKPNEKAKLRETQIKWHQNWKGQVMRLNSVDEAIKWIESL
jgi:rhamnose utilization protein RhaD (predicted bifunctional aldolase and dehydrogenase)